MMEIVEPCIFLPSQIDIKISKVKIGSKYIYQSWWEPSHCSIKPVGVVISDCPGG